jgi:hypothetical protein
VNRTRPAGASCPPAGDWAPEKAAAECAGAPPISDGPRRSPDACGPRHPVRKDVGEIARACQGPVARHTKTNRPWRNPRTGLPSLGTSDPTHFTRWGSSRD